MSNHDVAKGNLKDGEQHHVPPLLSELSELETLSITEKNTEPFPKPQASTPPFDDSSSNEDSLDGGSEEEDDEKLEEKIAVSTADSVLTPGAHGSVGSIAGSGSDKKLPFPEVSQVSKLLNAISTWVSVPQDSWVESQGSGVELQDHGVEPQDSGVESQGRMTEEHGSCDSILRSCDKDMRSSCDDDRSHDHQDLAKAHKNTDQQSHDGKEKSHDQRRSNKDSDKESNACHLKPAAHSDSGKTLEHDQNDKTSDGTLKHSNQVGNSQDKSSDRTSKHCHPKDKPEEGDPEGVFLPPVHSIDVGGIQRSLFNSQLRKHLSGVCPILGLSFHQVLPLVNTTTKKFR